jgi:hypothetical protein
MKPTVIAGCPANGREWVIRQWVSHLARAGQEAGVNLHLYMLCPGESTELIDAFEGACASNDVLPILVTQDEKPREDQRTWNIERYQVMADLRNTMLSTIRMMEPDYFLSIDSDILLGPGVLSRMIEDLEGSDYAAVGSKCYLAVGPRQTGKDGRKPVCNVVNYANLGRNGSLLRKDQEGFFPVDVLMAIKLMSPDAYNVDYEPHRQGEDIGWSNAVREAGLKLGWDGRIVSKHCMSQRDLHRVDDRVGW